MYEVSNIYKKVKALEAERFKLNLTEPKFTVPSSTFLFVCGMISNSTSLIVFSFALAGIPLVPVLNGVDKKALKKEIDETHFDKISQLHNSVKTEIYWAFRQLKNEQDPNKRKKIMETIRWMKNIDVIRQADKKDVMLLWGHKRKGLARGLKKLRRQVGTMSKEEYIRRRENILSYY